MSPWKLGTSRWTTQELGLSFAPESRGGGHRGATQRGGVGRRWGKPGENSEISQKCGDEKPRGLRDSLFSDKAQYVNWIKLVGGLEHGWIMTFHLLGIITPTDFHIFAERLKPPTS